MKARLLCVPLVAMLVAGAGSVGGAAEKMMDKKPGAQMTDDKKMSGDKMMDDKMMGKTIGEQLKVAAQHAALAKSATVLAGVKTHLQHVVNCLEGSGGGMFKAAGGNPCEGKGQGLIPDAMGGKMNAVLADAKAALAEATAGLKATAVSVARRRAAAAHAALVKAEKGMMMGK